MIRRTLAGTLGLAVALLGCGRATADPVHLSISCGAIGVELQLCTDAVARWEQETGVDVTIVTTPNSSTDRLALYLQMLGAGTDAVDILQIDVVWAGMLASHLVDLTPYLGDDPERHFPALIANDTVDGRLVAMPWWTDVGVLYYRSDLLARHGYTPPQTWQDLTETAQAIQAAERAVGNDQIWGFVFQGRAYEGLTCDALEWIVAFGGGTILDEKGRITVNNDGTREALTMAASWIGTIAPRGVLNYDEEAARGVFQTGNAVFMRNWPYAWALAQSDDSPVKGKVGVMPLPPGRPGGKPTGVLGGWHLAVSRYSKHPREAAQLVRFLTSPAEQKRRAVRAAYNPTIPALYDDPDVVAANPFFAELEEPLASATARPSRLAGAHYNRLSSDLWRAAHDIMAGAPVAARLAELEADLNRLAYRAQW